jgi:hypothetical protein
MAVNLPDLHFHDLRHTGGTLSAATGASLKELMARLGHSSVRAAMMYQHATRDRDRVIALALGDLIRQAEETMDQPGVRGQQDVQLCSPAGIMLLLRDPWSGKPGCKPQTA